MSSKPIIIPGKLKSKPSAILTSLQCTCNHFHNTGCIPVSFQETTVVDLDVFLVLPSCCAYLERSAMIFAYTLAASVLRGDIRKATLMVYKVRSLIHSGSNRYVFEPVVYCPDLY